MLHVKQPRTGYAKVGAQVSFSSPPFAREPRVGVRGSPRLPSPRLPHLHSIFEMLSISWQIVPAHTPWHCPPGQVCHGRKCRGVLRSTPRSVLPRAV